MSHDKETEAALAGSIAKWEAIVAGTGSDNGTANCPLCKTFMEKSDRDFTLCGGCPVREKTGAPSCDGSPYEEWSKYQEDLEMPYHIIDAESRRLAQAELDFLRSLKS